MLTLSTEDDLVKAIVRFAKQSVSGGRLSSCLSSGLPAGLLLLVPLLVLAYVLHAETTARKIVSGSGSLGLVRDLRDDRCVAALSRADLFVRITILLFSLARPQATVSLPRYEGTVILVFDVSGSMAADDIAPTRMEAAKAIGSRFVNGQPPGVRSGWSPSATAG
jgi:Ca-activated chloride channel homolog